MEGCTFCRTHFWTMRVGLYLKTQPSQRRFDEWLFGFPGSPASARPEPARRGGGEWPASPGATLGEGLDSLQPLVPPSFPLTWQLTGGPSTKNLSGPPHRCHVSWRKGTTFPLLPLSNICARVCVCVVCVCGVCGVCVCVVCVVCGVCGVCVVCTRGYPFF